MDTFADELAHRIADSRQSLRTAQDTADLDSERVYAGELDSLLRIAMENGIEVAPDAAPRPGAGQ